MRIGSNGMSPTNQLTQIRQAQQSGIVRKGVAAYMERLEALFAGGRQGMSEVKDQVASLVQAAKDGGISAAEFEQLTGIADGALQSGSGSTEKAQALHFISRLAHDTSRSLTNPADNAAPEQTMEQFILDWTRGYAQEHHLPESAPSYPAGNAGGRQSANEPKAGCAWALPAFASDSIGSAGPHRAGRAGRFEGLGPVLPGWRRERSQERPFPLTGSGPGLSGSGRGHPT